MRFYNKGEGYQRFGVRKLTVGVTSVLLGTTFMIFGSQTSEVHAADENNGVKVVESTKSSNAEQQSKDNQNNINSSVAKDAKTENASVNTQQTLTQPNNKENQESAKSDKSVAATVQSTDQAATKASGDVSQENMAKVDAVAKSVNKNTKVSDELKNKIAEAYHLNEPDLTDEQLAKLGLKHGEFYYDNGTKSNIIVGYENTDSTVTLYDGTVIDFGKINIRHNADGTVFNNNNSISDDDLFDLDIQKSNFEYTAVPNMTGKTIYVNKGSKLSTDDASRGVQNISGIPADSITDNQWDNTISGRKVNTNIAGEQNGVVDVTYSIGGVSTNVAVGVKVTVVDLKGQPIVTHIDADTPDPTKGVTGQPAGTTDIHWTQAPSTKTAGNTTGVVEVTYPDSTKGTATVPVTVIAPNVPDVIYVPKGDPVPDPSTVVTNNPEIQKDQPGTKYTWETTPDINKGGHIPSVVVTHWPDGKTTDSKTTIVVTEEINEKHEVVRTIIEKLPNQDPKTIKQSVTFTRTDVVDSADHSKIIKAGTWKADGPAAWGVFTPDQVKGYTATPAQVPAMAVSADTPNTTVEINYKSNTPNNPDTPVNPDIPTPPVNPSDPGDNPTPTNPTTPDTPAPTPHATTKPTKDNGKKSHVKGNGDKTKNSGLGNGEKVNTGRKGTATIRPLANAKPTSPAMKKTATADNTQKSALPQTGDKDNSALAAVGAAIAAAGSLLGLAGSKKRKS